MANLPSDTLAQANTASPSRCCAAPACGNGKWRLEPEAFALTAIPLQIELLCAGRSYTSGIAPASGQCLQPGERGERMSRCAYRERAPCAGYWLRHRSRDSRRLSQWVSCNTSLCANLRTDLSPRLHGLICLEQPAFPPREHAAYLKGFFPFKGKRGRVLGQPMQQRQTARPGAASCSAAASAWHPVNRRGGILAQHSLAQRRRFRAGAATTR